MATIDPTTPLGNVRLIIADYNDPVILTDAVINWVLSKNSNNINQSAKECASYILGSLSADTDERLDKIQFYGSQRFNQYLKYLTTVVNGSNSPLNATIGGIWFGGVDKSEYIANKCDETVKHTPEYPHYRLGYPEDWYTRGRTF